MNPAKKTEIAPQLICSLSSIIPESGYIKKRKEQHRNNFYLGAPA